MSRTATLYHNNRCSKSRAALALLQDRHYEVSIRRYLEEPLSKSELHALVEQLSVDPIHIIRHKEPEFKIAGLSKDSDKEALIQALVDYPKLLERPIVVTEKGARIGRPTELIEDILE